MYCLSELRGFGAVHEDLKKRGGRVLAISVDAPDLSRAVVEKQHLPYSILCDTDRKVVRAYGLMHSHGAIDGSDVAIPANVLVGKDGKILWRHVARSVADRVDPAEVSAVIAKLP